MQPHFHRLGGLSALTLLCAGVCLSSPFIAGQALAAAADTPAVVPVEPGIGVPLSTPPPAPLATSEPPLVPLPSGAVENSVVKVFSTKRYPDPFKPWTRQAPNDVTGSGVVIDGKRILTNAHVVLYTSQIQVQANQSGDKVPATLEAIAPGIDLAILKLDDESFFETHKPLPISKTLPGIKDAVMVYGYPQGGSSLAITKGIVSRIEFTGYNTPVAGLRIQIDAAINPGNSGGPAVDGDKLIGLAFSHLGGAENIGYIIPAEEIELFLHDIADGHYDGKPLIPDDFQTLENPALRAFLKLDKTAEGLVVSEPYKDDPAYPLKQWDVITRIGDVPVDNQGMVKIDGGLRVNFTYIAQKIVRDGKLPLTVIRNGREMAISLPAPMQRPTIFMEPNGTYPSYFIFGPVVFSEASALLVSSISKSGQGANYLWMLSFASSPLVTRLGAKPDPADERLVVIPAPFFPHKLARGYSDPSLQVVKSINGHEIRNLAQLVVVLRDLKDEFVTIEFCGRKGESLVLPRAEALAATDEILTDNGVRTQGSPDVLEIWKAAPPR